jgi:hypothetical protein
MRVLLGRVALLVGVLLVAGAAWYGATTLLDDDRSADDGGSDLPGCQPATKAQAQEANRAFRRRYAWTAWLNGFGVSDTHAVRRIAEQVGSENLRLPELDGDGSLLLVVVTRRAPFDQLPACVADVPVVYQITGPFRSD